jgi:hypothetical protein
MGRVLFYTQEPVLATNKVSPLYKPQAGPLIAKFSVGGGPFVSLAAKVIILQPIVCSFYLLPRLYHFYATNSSKKLYLSKTLFLPA